MPTLRIPAALRSYTGGQSEIPIAGDTVSAALNNLVKRYPELIPHLVNEDGELRPYVNVFLGRENIREIQGLDTPLREEDRLMIIPSIAGGR